MSFSAVAIEPAGFPGLVPVLGLEVRFRARTDARLPAFLGSTLHGAFGQALWRTVCAFPKRTRCDGCPILARCAYPALFEPLVPGQSELRSRGVSSAPRPLLIAPEEGWTRPSRNPQVVAAEAELPFRVALVGRSIADLPLVVAALKRMAERGLGRVVSPGAEPDSDGDRSPVPRAPFELASITRVDGSIVYDESSDLLRISAGTDPVILPADRESIDALTIVLTTPLRLKTAGKITGRPTPPELVRALCQRASLLSVLHGDGSEVDGAELVRLAGTVESEVPDLRLVHVVRHSGRQHATMTWPGVMGSLRWKGVALAALLPLLRFGELAQVGKGATLGFGRYRLEIGEARDARSPTP